MLDNARIVVLAARDLLLQDEGVGVPYKKSAPHTVTFFMMQQPEVGLPT